MNLSRGVRDAARLSHVINVMFREGLGFAVEEMRLKHQLPFVRKIMLHRFEEPLKPEARLRRVLEELGGTYVKLGQLLSVRPDLVPTEYCEELSKLQDRVAPFSTQKAKEMIESELKQTIHKAFLHFNDKPIAAASISQVHEAVLKGWKKVVVKVQRPNIRDIMYADIDVMYYLAKQLEKNERYKQYQPVAIVEEFEDYTKRELDFRIEGKNADTFARNFSKSKVLKVPRVHWELSTDKVLTMEKIEGIKLTEIKKKRINRKEVAKKIIDVLVKQIFEDGFFHADLHPGNIMVTDDRVAFLDFGIVGRLDNELKKRGLALLEAIIGRDADRITSILLKTGTMSHETNITLFREDVGRVINEWSGESLAEIKVTHIMHRLFNTCIEHKIKIPVNLILLGKGLITAEGTCKQLDPEFNFVEYARGYIERAIRKRMKAKEIVGSFVKESHRIRELLSEFPDQLTAVMERIKSGTIKMHIEDTDIKKVAMEMDRSSNRLAYGMIITGCIVGGALMANIQKGPQLWGMNAVAFVLFAMAIFFGIVLAGSIEREVRV